MTACAFPPRPPAYDKKVALVLQGGGALGSYQAGVYEMLAESEYPPDWVAGISIGAINAAIIAGNAPGARVARLREFWEGITEPTACWPQDLAAPFADIQRKSATALGLAFGQPGFFAPRKPFEWFSTPRPLSYYDTSALKATLERLVDFDRINSRKEIRLSVGAVNVRTGRLVYFDSAEMAIRPEHVMASGALPPGFPPVEIDGEFYWDGGLISNTPLQRVIDYVPRRSRLIFQVDVFPGYGAVPDDMDQVAERDKDIRYASRTRITTETFRKKHDVRHAINELLETLPPKWRETPEAKRLHTFGCVTTMDVVQIIYRPAMPQGSTKDYEFSRATMAARWRQGAEDARVTLRASPWLAPAPREVGLRTFDVLHNILVGKLTAGDGTKAPKPEAGTSAEPRHTHATLPDVKHA
jgi:NTE family protein